MNRNFSQDWEEHDSAAGLFPTDEPEVRGLCEFVLGRKDIQMVLVYGESHNMGGKLKKVDDDAPAKKRVPPSGLRASDAALLEELGETYRSVTGNEAASGGELAGTFQAWCYGHRGLFCLEITPWSLPLDTEKPEGEAPEETGRPGEAGDAGDAEAGAATTDGAADGEPGGDDPGDGPGDDPGKKRKDKDEPEPSDDAKRLVWIDAGGEDEEWRHLGWTVYEHPELGPVEIGGFAPFGKTDPPPTERAEVAEKELEFLIAAGEKLATVGIADAKARALGGGLLEVEARVENTGFLPLLSTWGLETRSTRPALVEIRLPKGAELLAGERKQLVSDLAGSGGHRELRWLVRGANAAAIGIHVETDHAGEAPRHPGGAAMIVPAIVPAIAVALGPAIPVSGAPQEQDAPPPTPGNTGGDHAGTPIGNVPEVEIPWNRLVRL